MMKEQKKWRKKQTKERPRNKKMKSKNLGLSAETEQGMATQEKKANKHLEPEGLDEDDITTSFFIVDILMTCLGTAGAGSD